MSSMILPYSGTRVLASLIVVLSISTGCVHNKSVKVSRITGKDIVVVPVSGQPVLVHSENLGVIALATVAGGLPGAIIANSVQQNTTASKRATLVGRLNEDYRDFMPEVILAEECVKLLQASKKVRFNSVTLRSESVPLPGRAELIATDPRPFTSLVAHRFDWHKRTVSWMKTVAPPDAAGSPSEAASAITVEVTFAVLDLVNGKKLDPSVVIRVVDPVKRQVIGTQYVADRFKIRPVTLSSGLDTFNEDLRKSIRELARKGLKDLNLL